MHVNENFRLLRFSKLILWDLPTPPRSNPPPLLYLPNFVSSFFKIKLRVCECACVCVCGAHSQCHACCVEVRGQPCFLHPTLHVGSGHRLRSSALGVNTFTQCSSANVSLAHSSCSLRDTRDNSSLYEWIILVSLILQEELAVIIKAKVISPTSSCY